VRSRKIEEVEVNGGRKGSLQAAGTAPNWKIGRNIAITMPPTTIRDTMSSGSMSEVRPPPWLRNSVS